MRNCKIYKKEHMKWKMKLNSRQLRSLSYRKKLRKLGVWGTKQKKQEWKPIITSKRLINSKRRSKNKIKKLKGLSFQMKICRARLRLKWSIWRKCKRRSLFWTNNFLLRTFRTRNTILLFKRTKKNSWKSKSRPNCNRKKSRI